MGRWSEELSEEQRNAVTAAMLDGMAAPEVVAAAAAGELWGLAPFAVSETTCRDLRQEAERSNGSPDPGAPADQREAEEREYWEGQIDRLKAIEEPTNKEFLAMKTAMAALADVKRREGKQAARRPPEPEPEQTDEEPSELVRQMLAHDREIRTAEAEGRTRPCTCEPPTGDNPDRCDWCGLPLPTAEELERRAQA